MNINLDEQDDKKQDDKKKIDVTKIQEPEPDKPLKLDVSKVQEPTPDQQPVQQKRVQQKSVQKIQKIQAPQTPQILDAEEANYQNLVKSGANTKEDDQKIYRYRVSKSSERRKQVNQERSLTTLTKEQQKRRAELEEQDRRIWENRTTPVQLTSLTPDEYRVKNIPEPTDPQQRQLWLAGQQQLQERLKWKQEQAKRFGITKGADGLPTSPKEGLVVSQESSRLTDAGIKSSSTIPEADEDGLITGFSGQAVVNLSQFNGLTGKDYRKAVAKKYISFLTPDAEIQNVSADALELIAGNESLFQDLVTETPYEDTNQVLELSGETVVSGDNVFTIYQDRKAVVPKLIQVAKIMRSQGKTPTPQELVAKYKEVQKVIDDYNSELDKTITSRENQVKGTEQATTGSWLYDVFSWGRAFGEENPNTDTMGGTLSSRLYNVFGIQDRVNPTLLGYQGVSKDREQFDSLNNPISALVQLNTYQQNTRLNTAVENLSRNGSNLFLQMLAYAPQATRGGVPTFLYRDENFAKVGLTDRFLATQLTQTAPAFIPYVGIPYMIALSEVSTRDLPKTERYANILVTTATMGASKFFSSPLAVAKFGGKSASVLDGLSNVTGATGMTALNWESFKNQDGSIRWGDVFGNSVFDLAQLGGRDIPNVVRNFSSEPKGIGLVVKDVDTGQYHAFFKDAQDQVFLKEVPEDYVTSLRDQAQKEGKFFGVQELNNAGIETIKSQNPTFRDRLRKAVFGENTKNTEIVDVNDPTLLRVDGKELRTYTYKDAENFPKIEVKDYEQRSANFLYALNERKFSIAEISGDIDFIQTFKNMKDEGLLSVDEKGVISITDLGKRTLEQREAYVAKQREELQAPVELPERTTVTEVSRQNQETFQNKEQLAKYENKYLRESYNGQGERPVDVSLSDYSGMSEMEKTVVKQGIALGKLELDGDRVVNKSYTTNYEGKTLDFGVTNESKLNERYYQVAKAYESGKQERALAISEDISRVTKQSPEEIKTKSKEVFDAINKRANEEIAKYNLDRRYTIDVSETTKETVKIAEETTQAPTEVKPVKQATEPSVIITDRKTGQKIPLVKDEDGLFRDPQNRIYSPEAVTKNLETIWKIDKQEFSSKVFSKLDNLYERVKRVFGSKDLILSGKDNNKNKLNWITKSDINYDTRTKGRVWNAKDEGEFVQSKVDDTRYYSSQRFLNTLSALDSENAGLIRSENNGKVLGNGGNSFDASISKRLKRQIDDLLGLETYEDGNTTKLKNSNPRNEELLSIRQRLSDNELKQLKDFSNKIKNQDVFDVVSVTRERGFNYFTEASKHEATHKAIFRQDPSKSAFKVIDNNDVDSILSTEHGKRFIENARKGGLYRDASEVVLLHEIIPTAVEPESLLKLGIKSDKDVVDFAKTYADLLETFYNKYGKDAVNQITKYIKGEDFRLLEDIKQEVLRNERRINRGLKGSQGTGQGRFSSKSYGTLEEGSGVKRLRLRRYTASGDPFELTGKNGQERRLREGGKPTFNFFVRKMDGTWVIEPEFQNTRLLSTEIDGEFNLLDISQDPEALAFYRNNRFDKFQEYAEGRGFDGFFAGHPDIPDWQRYRVSVFDNESNRNKIQSAPRKDYLQNLATQFNIKADVVDGMFSPIEEALYSPNIPEKTSGQQVLNILKNYGISDEELKWSGLKEYLGNKSVNRQDLLQFAKENRLKVEEVTLSGDEPQYNRDDLVLGGERKNDVELLITLPELDRYQSGHYTQENIVAHVRANERLTDAVEIPDSDPIARRFRESMGLVEQEGVKTFHIEEIQSDWHEAGRAEGYTEDLTANFNKLREERDRLHIESESILKQVREHPNLGKIYGGKELDDLRSKYVQLKERIARIDREMNQPRKSIPQAPFKDTWHELGFKKALRYAVENGYERLTWTTGKQQIDRYNTYARANVDSISYERSMTGLEITVKAQKDGKEVFNDKLHFSGETKLKYSEPTTLNSLVGKNIADQMRSSDSRFGTISGENLSIGGQFHKLLYDQKLPSFAKKYVKQWGGKVEESEIKTSSKNPNLSFELYDRDGIYVASYRTKEDAQKRIQDYVDRFGDNPDNYSIKDVSDIREKVWSVDITPEMVKSVQEGQPLFGKRVEFASKSEDYREQAIKNLMRTSRTASGIVDTSASKGKADAMTGVTGDEAGRLAIQNFSDVIDIIYDSRNNYEEGFSDFVNQKINKGIVKEGVLYRQDDSDKYPYTRIKNLKEAKAQFEQELTQRLSDPNADPIETSAWIEWRANLTDHFWADGVGKTSKALAMIPLMKAGVELPKYRDNKEFFRQGAPVPYDITKGGGKVYLDKAWDDFLDYYKILFKEEPQAHQKTFTPVTEQLPEVFNYNGKEYSVGRAVQEGELGRIEVATIKEVINNTEGLFKQFEERFGKDYNVANADDFKELFPQFRENKLLASSGVHEASSILNKIWTDKKLAELPKNSLVIMMAGGASSGKSWTVKQMGLENMGDFIIDTVAGNAWKNRAMIDKIRDYGHDLLTIYVDTDIDLASRLSIKRAEEEGRFVPLPQLADGHYGAKRSFILDTYDYVNKKISDEVVIYSSIKGQKPLELSFVKFREKGYNSYRELLKKAVNSAYEEYRKTKQNPELGELIKGTDPNEILERKKGTNQETSQRTFGTEFASRSDSRITEEDRGWKMLNIYRTPANKLTTKELSPLIKEGNWSALTAIRDGDTSKMAELEKDLTSMGYEYIRGKGIYGGQEEDSFFVYYPQESTQNVINYLGSKYNQESVLHGRGGQYTIQFTDGSNQKIESDSVRFTDSQQDRTELTLANGEKFNFTVDLDFTATQPSQVTDIGRVKYEARQNSLKSNILSPEDIRRVLNGQIKLTDLDGKEVKIPEQEVRDLGGKVVGTVKVDSEGRQYFTKDKEKIYLVDGKGYIGKEASYFVGKSRRPVLGAVAYFQELIHILDPNLPYLERPKKGSPEFEEYNVKRAEVVMSHITKTLENWKEDGGYGRGWYQEELNNFAEKVSKTIPEVKKDIVKYWLFLQTGLTSPHTDIETNAQYAFNALGSFVRFYETGKLYIPTFQFDNEGKMILKSDGNPKQLGLGSRSLEKTRLMLEGYVSATSPDGRQLDGEVLTTSEVYKRVGITEKANYEDKFIFNPVLAEKLKAEGKLTGFFNYLFSPSTDNFNKAVDVYGDKLGAFFSNLVGIQNNPTIDTWMLRYFMSLTGEAVKAKRDENGNITKLQAPHLSFPKEDIDFFSATIQKATEDWNKKTGDNLAPADTQAIIWTQVKDLYNDLTNIEEKNIDFSQAYEINKAKGFLPEATNEQLAKDTENLSLDIDTNYGDNFYVDKYGTEFAIKSDDDLTVQQKKLEEAKLEEGDFVSWVNVASRFVKNGLLTEEETSTIKQLAEKKDIKGLKKFVAQINKMPLMELLTGFFRTNLLMSTKMIERNFATGELLATSEQLARLPSAILESILVSGVNKLREDGARYRTTELSLPFLNVTFMKSLYHGITKGVKRAYETMKEGDTSVMFEDVAFMREKTTGWAVLKPIEAYVKYGNRIVSAIDKPLREQGYSIAINELINRKSKALGISKDEAKASLTFEELAKAQEYSEFMVFQEGNALSSKYYSTKEKRAGLVKFFLDLKAPFIKTPLNVVKRAVLDYSGFYPVMKELSKAKKKFDTSEWETFKDKVYDSLDNDTIRALSWGFGRGLIGWGSVFLGYAMAKNGFLEANYEDKDRKERELDRLKGSGNGAILYNGYSYEIGSLTPISLWLLTGALMYKVEEQEKKQVEEGKTKPEDYNTNVLMNFSLKSLKNIAMATPLLSDAVEIVTEAGKGEKADLAQFVGANRVVPSIVGEIAQQRDQKQRLIGGSGKFADKLADQVKNMIPTLRETLPIQYDMLGREITSPAGFDPLRTRKIDDNAVVKELDRFGITFIPKSSGNRLQDNENRKKAGDLLRPQLETIISSEAYQKADDVQKKKILEDSISFIRREDKSDNLKPQEESYNLEMIRNRELLRPNAIKIISKFSDVAEKDRDKYFDNFFRNNFMATSTRPSGEATEKFKEFSKDPEAYITKYYEKGKKIRESREKSAEKKRKKYQFYDEFLGEPVSIDFLPTRYGRLKEYRQSENVVDIRQDKPLYQLISSIRYGSEDDIEYHDSFLGDTTKAEREEILKEIREARVSISKENLSKKVSAPILKKLTELEQKYGK